MQGKFIPYWVLHLELSIVLAKSLVLLEKNSFYSTLNTKSLDIIFPFVPMEHKVRVEGYERSLPSNRPMASFGANDFHNFNYCQR